MSGREGRRGAKWKAGRSGLRLWGQGAAPACVHPRWRSEAAHPPALAKASTACLVAQYAAPPP